MQRFATIAPIESCEDVEVHGIAHQLSMRELRVLDKYEGAVGPEGAVRAYERFVAMFTPYPSKTGVPLAPFEVQTYRATTALLTEAAPPSQRYLDLLVSGAAAIGLDTAYISWLRSHSTFACDGLVMPEVTADARSQIITLDELARHSYELDPSNVWVAMGGQCYDISKLAKSTMLRNMSGQDGTLYVLRMRDAAYGDGVPSLLTELSEKQWAYVASWAQYLVSSGCQFIGFLQSPTTCTEVVLQHQHSRQGDANERSHD
mmetsp:Transcript_38583/g.88477  ORF Transcript_38583/g.88477 Transcript_38583/m.88477 type:complete len:260 (-) Transcript_38583:65-844(-)